MGALDTSAERRRAPRRRTLKGARIALDKNSVRNCTVRNLSATGARLEMPNTLGLPAEFAIAVSGEADRRCRIAWQSLGAVGVAFV